jgi:hypothetical protein
MPSHLPKPRHIVENSSSLVRITLPSKKNIFQILWLLIWLFMWGYMTLAMLYGAVIFKQAIDIGGIPMPAIEPGTVFVSVILLLILLGLLSLGTFGIYRLIWILAGREVIEANPTVLRLTRATFLGKSSQEYSMDNVKELRVGTPPSFIPFKRIQRFLGILDINGMIAFDYGAKTFRFGAEIDEAEAKQIIRAVEEGFHQSKAG